MCEWERERVSYDLGTEGSREAHGAEGFREPRKGSRAEYARRSLHHRWMIEWPKFVLMTWTVWLSWVMHLFNILIYSNEDKGYEPFDPRRFYRVKIHCQPLIVMNSIDKAKPGRHRPVGLEPTHSAWRS
jgi:hypothetical protein